MSVDAGSIYSEVRVRLDKLSGDIKEVQKSFDQLGKDNQVQADKVEKGWSDGFGKMKIAALAAFAAIAVYVKSSVSAYLEHEEALTKLSAALRTTGEYSTLAVSSLADFASQLQRTTKFDDDATISATALLISLGGMTSKVAQDTIPAIQDFASAMGIDLVQAAELYAKSASGTVNMLSRYGITIKEGLTGTERMTALTGALEQRFGGLAQAIGDTASGKLTQLKNAFADVQKEVGRATVDAIQPFVSWLSKVVTGIGDFLKAANDLHDALIAQQKGIADTNDKLIIARAHYQDVNTQLHNFTDAQWLANNAMVAMSIATQHGFGSIDEYIKSLKEQNTAARAAMTSIERKAQAEIDEADTRSKAAKDAEIAEQKRLKAEQDANVQAAADGQEALDKQTQLAEDTQKAWQDYYWAKDDARKADKKQDEKYAQDEIEAEVAKNQAIAESHATLVSELTDQYSLLTDISTSAMRDIFTSIGKDLAEGTLSWRSFGESVIHVIGKIVSALGDQLAADAAKELIEAIAASLDPFTMWAAPGMFGAAAVMAGGAAAAYLSAALLENISLLTGGIVLPRKGGTIVRMAENNAPELALNGGPEGKPLLRKFARDVAREMGGGTTQIFLDGKLIAESTAGYFNKGITRLKK